MTKLPRNRGSSVTLGTVFNVHVFWESRKDCYRKAMIDPSLTRIDPWENILLKFFFRVDSKFLSYLHLRIDLCPWIVNFFKANYSFQIHIIFIKVSFNSWVYNSSECSSFGWFFIWVNWALLITNSNKIKCLQSLQIAMGESGRKEKGKRTKKQKKKKLNG